MKSLLNLYTQFRQARHTFHFMAIATLAFVLIVSAFVIEHGFGAQPCHLCWHARYGHWAMLFLALVGFVAPQKYHVFMLKSLFLAALYGFGLGIYHSLVQAKVIAGPSGCSGAQALPTDIKSFNQFLANPTLPPRCDEASFYILGASLPVWNIITMAFLMLVIYDVLRISKNQQEK